MSNLIIGTSGHIDHGKTTLLKALTGVYLDRSPEEKKRGITIDLGFTHMQLPSGRDVSFIDVPGHERLVRTMIAGASGMDAVLLCISAVEGVMPQTREHIAILNLLGVQQGVIALTMTDLVDSELLELAELDIEDLVAGTPFEAFPIVHTAAGEQPVGIDALIEKLEAIPEKKQSDDAPFRLFIDRIFVQTGFGTVVTGTTRGQSISIGESLMVHPTAQRTRVRNIQQHGQSQEHSQSNQRTALNLAGLSHQDLARGQVLMRDNSIPPTSILDIEYHHLPEAPDLKGGTRVRFLVGSNECLARIYFYDSEEAQSDRPQLAQLRLSEPVVVLSQDRVIIRRESPVTTLGGGHILDPWAPKLRQKNHTALRQSLEALQQGNTMAALERCGSKGMSRVQANLWQIEASELDARLYHPTIIDQWCVDIQHVLSTYHRDNRLSMGMPLRELHSQSLHFLSPKAFEQLVVQLVQGKHIEQMGARVKQVGFEVVLTETEKSQATTLIKRADSTGWEGLELPTENLDLIHHLLGSEELIAIQQRLFHPQQVQRLIAALHHHFEHAHIMTPVDFKGLTGLSRKHAIPWLEWLDSSGITQRTSEGRKLRSKK